MQSYEAPIEFSPGRGIDSYYQAVTDIQRRIMESQRSMLIRTAEKMAEIIFNGGRIFTFGTGHSHILAEESYCRAGGLASVVPIFYTALMLHESIAMEAKIERMSGLASDLLDRAKVEASELLVIFSNSGVNQLPVEMAHEAGQRGIVTAAISSKDFAAIAPLSSIGRRLLEIVDYPINNGGVAGDGLVAIPGHDWKAGPSSTVIGAMLWNALVVETVWRIQTHTGDAPIGASLNMPGADEYLQQVDRKKFNIAPQHF